MKYYYSINNNNNSKTHKSKISYKAINVVCVYKIIVRYFIYKASHRHLLLLEKFQYLSGVFIHSHQLIQPLWNIAGCAVHLDRNIVYLGQYIFEILFFQTIGIAIIIIVNDSTKNTIKIIQIIVGSMYLDYNCSSFLERTFITTRSGISRVSAYALETRLFVVELHKLITVQREVWVVHFAS